MSSKPEIVAQTRFWHAECYYKNFWITTNILPCPKFDFRWFRFYQGFNLFSEPVFQVRDSLRGTGPFWIKKHIWVRFASWFGAKEMLFRFQRPNIHQVRGYKTNQVKNILYCLCTLGSENKQGNIKTKYCALLLGNLAQIQPIGTNGSVLDILMHLTCIL